MPHSVNRRVVLARRPNGQPVPEDFAIREDTIGELADGEVLIDVEHLSIDAFIRTTLDGDGFHGTMGMGETITALGTGRVVSSRFSGLNQGDSVFGPLGAQTLARLNGSSLRKIDDGEFEPRHYLGALGLTTGLTAYAGMIEVGEVRPGDLVVVSAAAGAVGTIACQLARIKGATVVGIAGGAHKVEFLRDEIGCEHAIDYKNENVSDRLSALAPKGIDLYFDNVGGEQLDIVLDRIGSGARVVICGAISQYNNMESVRGPELYLRLAERNSSMRGFTVNHFSASHARMERELAGWVKSGQLKMPEHIETGIERFPDALVMLFTGGHMGKLLVAP